MAPTGRLDTPRVDNMATQLLLFGRHDIRCFKVRGTYRVDGRDVGEEWEGRWEGRAVVVRTI